MGAWARRGGEARLTTAFELLPWDSGQFGFQVARWLGPDDVTAVVKAFPFLRDAGVRLVYLAVPPSNEDPFVRFQEAGARWVDRKTRFVHEVVPETSTLEGLTSFPAGEPTPGLVELALSSGVHSRFRADPLMPPTCFETLYTEWIRRSTTREIAEEVLICGGIDYPLGLVTLGVKGETVRIGLIAVGAEARGRGLGTQLIRAGERWAFARGATRMEVVTQGSNLAACALYQKCGYEIASLEDVYHLWVEPEAP